MKYLRVKIVWLGIFLLILAGCTGKIKGVNYLQAVVLDLWLYELNGKWNNGTMLWFWSSDPCDGGPQDKGFTIQNKRAEKVSAKHWKGKVP